MTKPIIKRVTIDLEWAAAGQGKEWLLSSIDHEVEGYFYGPRTSHPHGLFVTDQRIRYIEKSNPTALVEFEGQFTTLNMSAIIEIVRRSIAAIESDAPSDAYHTPDRTMEGTK